MVISARKIILQSNLKFHNMLRISDYSERINALHEEGKTALEIAKILNPFLYSLFIFLFSKSVIGLFAMIIPLSGS